VPAGRRDRPGDGRRPGRPHGIPVDEHLCAAERLWAIGDVNGIWPLTHVGEYEGEVVTANITGHPRPANYEAVPRITCTDPQAAAVGTLDAAYSGTALVLKVSKTATDTHAYARSSGFLTLLSDGEQRAGAYTPGAEPASGCSRRRWPSAPTS
jgi:pyruvate/2-oxoglutarate dehydrogenase complex dihydrolipoamide dehydrogenase (E3) component